MDDERRKPQSQNEETSTDEPAEEGLVDPRDLVDSGSPVPEIVRPQPLSEQSADREPNQ